MDGKTREEKRDPGHTQAGAERAAVHGVEGTKEGLRVRMSPRLPA